MHKILSATLAASVLAAGVAQAGTTSTTFAVTATVNATCSAAATTLAFPAYTPGAGAVTGNSTITLTCTNGAQPTVALNPGTTTGDAFTQRLMASGTNTLQYNLYTSAGYGTVWGDGTGSTKTVQVPTPSTGIGTPQTLTVYGQLLDSATNKNAVPGSYSDLITATVTY
jgi:spore coat protein U domain-containing protein, fimbrial subunit CupE1/2/3/6